jgi:uncharacterized protein (DUF58 family)
VLVSDFLAPLDLLESRLGYLRAGGNEVAVFQILDPAELEFPFADAALFVDAESGKEIYVDPRAARQNYRRQLEQHNQALATICDKLGIQLCPLTTDAPLERALFDFLRTRVQLTLTRRR